MRKVARFSLILVTLTAVFLAGAWVNWKFSGRARPQAGRKVLYWVDPMHPSYKSDKPGVAPDCGMQLEPVYADDPSGGPSAALPAGALRISDDKRQLIGVRVGTAEERPVDRAIRTVGRVVVDENRLYRLLAASEGITRQIFDNGTGSLVRKNQLLLTFFTRDYLTAEQAYFFGLDTLDRLTKSGAPEDQLKLTRAQVRSAIDGLLNLGMGEIQIAALAKTRTATTEIELRAPVTGYLIARNVSPQQRFERSTELYQIADLARVWILADLFENEARYLRPGTRVRASQAYARSTPFEVRVSDVLPRFDADSRTLKIRLDADNPDYSLRPGMFVDVELPVSLPRAVTVPADAVVDSGARKRVFVDRGNGVFEPRPVETGWRFDDRVEIVSGLKAGERVVLSGAFLLDSESRMNAAASGIVTPVRDPVCEMEVDRDKVAAAGRTATYRGRTFYFCSDECRRKFENDPAKYTPAERPASRPPENAHPNPVANLRPIQLPGLETVPGADSAAAPVATARRFQQLATAQAGDGSPVTVPSATTPAPATASPAATGGAGVEAPKAVAIPPPGEKAAPVVVDVACGTLVMRDDAEKAGLTSRYKGAVYHFSSKDCKAKFDAEPARYVK